MVSDESPFGPPPWESDVALYIDWQHFKPTVQRRGLPPDPSVLIDAASRYGRLVVAKAYADWGSPADSHDAALLSEAGIEPVYTPFSGDSEGRHRSYSTSVRLNTDCMETSFITPHISTYVLATGSYRFPHLAQSLRKRGFRVVLIGIYRHSPHPASDQADEILHYDRLIERAAQNDAPESQGPPEDLASVVESLVRLVKEQRENGRFPLLSWLGHQLRRQTPGFNPQVYGFEKFKDLVRYVERAGRLRIVTHDLLDWAMLPGDDPDVGRAGGFENPPLPPADSPGDAPPALVTLVSHPVLESPQPFIDYRDVFEELVRTVCEMEEDPRYEFITPGFLGQSIWRRGHWDQMTLPQGTSPVSSLLRDLRAGQIRRLVDFAISEGLLYATAQFDPDTGKSFSTVRVRRAHSFAQSVLNHLRENASPTDADEPGPDGDEDEGFNGYSRTG